MQMQIHVIILKIISDKVDSFQNHAFIYNIKSKKTPHFNSYNEISECICQYSQAQTFLKNKHFTFLPVRCSTHGELTGMRRNDQGLPEINLHSENLHSGQCLGKGPRLADVSSRTADLHIFCLLQI